MPKITLNELKKHISDKNLNKVYFFQGEEYLIEYFEAKLTNTIIKKSKNDFDINIFNSQNLNIENLENALETFPIASEKKCVIIHDLPLENWSADEIQKFIKIISDIPDFSILIISNYTEFSKNAKIKFKKIEKAIIENGILINFSKKDIDAEKLLIKLAKNEYDKNLSPDLAKLICNSCANHSLNGLKSELKKICEFENNKTIPKNAIEVVIKSKLKSKIFDLPKAIFSKNTKKSFELLNDLINQKEEPIAIIAVISNEYIDIFRTKILLNNSYPASKLSEIFDYKNKEFRIKNAEIKCRNLSLSAIEKSLHALLEADESLKSVTINPKIILQTLIIKLIKYLN